MPERIRSADAADLEGIRLIYNHAVLHSTATLDVRERSRAEQEAWFAARSPRHPLLVAEDGGRILGWAAVSTYIARPGADGSGEVGIYLDAAARGRGLGGRLLEALCGVARDRGLRVLVSRITHDNEPSLRLHARCGFIEAGRIPRVGHKLGRILDLVYMARVLDPD